MKSENERSKVSEEGCFNCGSEIPIAIWDDSALSGNLALFCENCDSGPETNLWQEGEAPNHTDYEIPPLPEDESWEVYDHYRNWLETVVDKYNIEEDVENIEEAKDVIESQLNFSDGSSHIMDKPEGRFEIVVDSLENDDAIAEARAEVRDRLEELDRNNS